MLRSVTSSQVEFPVGSATGNMLAFRQTVASIDGFTCRWGFHEVEAVRVALQHA